MPSMWERKVTPSSSMLAQPRQRHDLETARIGQDRTVPVHQAVQAAEGRTRSAPGRSMRW